MSACGASGAAFSDVERDGESPWRREVLEVDGIAALGHFAEAVNVGLRS